MHCSQTTMTTSMHHFVLKTRLGLRLRPHTCERPVQTNLAVADLSVVVSECRENVKQHRTLLALWVGLLLVITSEEHVVGKRPMHVYTNPPTSITYLHQPQHFSIYICSFFKHMGVKAGGSPQIRAKRRTNLDKTVKNSSKKEKSKKKLKMQYRESKKMYLYTRYCSRMLKFPWRGDRDLDCWNLCLILKISYGGCSNLTLVISAQFTFKVKVTGRNCKNEVNKTFILLFKVIPRSLLSVTNESTCTTS